MDIETVLATLEEYFEIKRDLVSSIEPNVLKAKERAGRALNEYIQKRFDNLMVQQEHRKLSSSTSTTRKMVIPDASGTKFTWEDIVGLLDALNTPPNPLASPEQLNNQEYVDRWMKSYKEWYLKKRSSAMRSLSSPQGLDLDLDDDGNWK